MDKEIVKTLNIFLIECIIEHVSSKKDSVKLLQKIDLVRKCKGVLFLFKLIGGNGRHLKNCRRVVEERSRML